MHHSPQRHLISIATFQYVFAKHVLGDECEVIDGDVNQKSLLVPKLDWKTLRIYHALCHTSIWVSTMDGAGSDSMRASGYPVLSMIVSTVYVGEVTLSIDGSSGCIGCIRIRKHRAKAKLVADERHNDKRRYVSKSLGWVGKCID
jgi:hypothetical protein